MPKIAEHTVFDQNEFRIALLEKGITQGDLALEYGCRRESISLFLTGKYNSVKLKRFISKRLGIKPLEN